MPLHIPMGIPEAIFRVTLADALVDVCLFSPFSFTPFLSPDPGPVVRQVKSCSYRCYVVATAFMDSMSCDSPYLSFWAAPKGCRAGPARTTRPMNNLVGGMVLLWRFGRPYWIARFCAPASVRLIMHVHMLAFCSKCPDVLYST